MFKEFLESEYAVENLHFWRAVEDFRVLSDDKLVSRGQQVYASFIQEGAHNELNLTAPVKVKLHEAFAPLSPQKVHRKIFDVAQKCILDLMRSDNFTRFLRTPMYQSLLSEAKWNEEVDLNDFLNEIHNMKMQTASPAPSDKKKKEKK